MELGVRSNRVPTSVLPLNTYQGYRRSASSLSLRETRSSCWSVWTRCGMSRIASSSDDLPAEFGPTRIVIGANSSSCRTPTPRKPDTANLVITKSSLGRSVVPGRGVVRWFVSSVPLVAACRHTVLAAFKALPVTQSNTRVHQDGVEVRRTLQMVKRYRVSRRHQVERLLKLRSRDLPVRSTRYEDVTGNCVRESRPPNLLELLAFEVFNAAPHDVDIGGLRHLGVLSASRITHFDTSIFRVCPSILLRSSRPLAGGRGASRPASRMR